jgi:hypothetical protein
MGQEEEPDFIFRTDDPRSATTQIADHWISRWLLGRVEHTETLAKLADFIPRDHAVSRDYGEDEIAPHHDLGL